MDKTDKEVLELCRAWFEDIMERSDRLTSGNVAHGRAAIRGVARNYAEFVAEHLEERWKPSEEQLKSLQGVIDAGYFTSYPNALKTLYKKLKDL